MVVLKENSDELRCKYDRQTVSYADLTERYKKEGDSYMKQFASLYVKRLDELSSVLKQKVREKWGSNVDLIPLSELENQNGKRCVIIGTLYKHQTNKPSILQELSEEHQMTAPAPKVHYCLEEDQLFLEDQTSRIKLTGDKVDVKESVTGVVCAVIGAENKKSTFEVEDWCFPGCLPQKEISSKPVGKLVILSGLELATNPPDLSLSLLVEWISGLAGTTEYQKNEAFIVRVVIAGNSIKACADQHLSKGLLSGRAEDAANANNMSEGKERLDTLLETLGSNCYVTILPGQFDVTTLMMPQNAMHPGSFPKARRFKSINGVTNPWIGTISDRIVVGTAGLPIQDIQKVCGLSTVEPIEWLQRSVEWRHLCPTAPDTIPCIPFCKSDPFILRECPDIYFAGNMEKYDTRLYQGNEGQKIRLICVPKFANDKTAVLVDLETLDATPISFGSE
ncbi:DNA polymerase delta small subunit-like [Copidosoma floridanum]|uniref:DNA polymerase delta small subunit-like n=1 Tax=Copidosoma floridanum TaxID=29053 RepID=UPI000C6FC7E9|nr:DNA polymerase delta small subunit-like [Copidosoma floridanum]